MDFHCPYHEKLGAGAPDKASLLPPQQGGQCMRVHSPFVGECDPSLIFRHWDPFEPPVGSAVLRVGAPSVQCLGSLHNPAPVGH